MKNNGKISFGLCALLLFPALAGAALAGCSSAVDPSKATATLSSTRAYGKNTAEKAMDGDLTSGWISAGMPSETNIPVLEVNFDRKAAVTSITIDDSFAGGRTTEIKEYETFLPSLKSSAFAYTSMPRLLCMATLLCWSSPVERGGSSFRGSSAGVLRGIQNGCRGRSDRDGQFGERSRSSFFSAVCLRNRRAAGGETQSFLRGLENGA